MKQTEGILRLVNDAKSLIREVTVEETGKPVPLPAKACGWNGAGAPIEGGKYAASSSVAASWCTIKRTIGY